jgi:HSP20 family protein
MTNEQTITQEKIPQAQKEAKKEVNKEFYNRVREIAPDVDIYADANHIYLESNLPGVDETTLDISFEKDTLTIFGKSMNPRLDNFTLKYAEFRNGNYRRSFQFQESIDPDGIEAAVKNGVLSLKIPVKKPDVKKINVKIAEA